MVYLARNWPGPQPIGALARIWLGKTNYEEIDCPKGIRSSGPVSGAARLCLSAANFAGSSLGNGIFRKLQTFGDETQNNAAFLLIVQTHCDFSHLSCHGFHSARPHRYTAPRVEYIPTPEERLFKIEQPLIFDSNIKRSLSRPRSRPLRRACQSKQWRLTN